MICFVYKPNINQETNQVSKMNKELETLVNSSNPPHSHDMLYNWVVTHKRKLFEILSKTDKLELIYWDDDEPIWREPQEKKYKKGD